MSYRLLGLVVTTLLLTACAKPPYTNVDNEGLEQLLQRSVALVDIRRPEEWRETGIVQGSHRLTFVNESGRVMPGFLESFTSKFSKDRPVALICRTGNRTNVLARHLVEQLGYTQVYNVRYGITNWIGAGLPVTRG